MEKEKPDIRSMTLEELTEELGRLKEPSFRAGQIFQWLHEKMAPDFESMTNLSRDLRRKLEENYQLITLKQADVRISAIDGTRKYLYELPDGNIIESVWMQYKHGNSVCISSQVGCRMGCRFCASTLDGLERGLTASEMLEQIYRIQTDTKERVSNIVVMGTGEPLDNYENLIRFLHLISSEKGLHISLRNITVSTCGLVPQIYRLAKENLPITLALSLHAPNDEKRRELMPITRKYPLEEVLEACDAYFTETGRRISFEYSLVKGVNDNTNEAEELSRLLKGKNCHVNLIPVNPIKEREYRRSSHEEIEAFKNTLEKNGINATVRREMGSDIQGACGQLRRSHLAENRIS